MGTTDCLYLCLYFLSHASLYCSFALEVLCSQLCDNANVQRVEKSDLKKAVQSFFNTTTSQKPSGNYNYMIFTI